MEINSQDRSIIMSIWVLWAAEMSGQWIQERRVEMWSICRKEKYREGRKRFCNDGEIMEADRRDDSMGKRATEDIQEFL